MLSVSFSYRYAECRLAESRYAKCRYVECSGAIISDECYEWGL
jgi:hypothetical protein